MPKIFSFQNLATPTGVTYPSLTAAVDSGVAATNAVINQVRGMTKVERRDYLKLNTTTWPCLCLVEGVNPGMRVSSDNPPQLLHGFAADFDNVGKCFTVQELTDLAARCAYPPAAAGSSLSGDGVHAIWLFKEPIPLLGNSKYAHKVMTVCFNKLRVGNFMQGFDNAFKNPDRLLSVDPQNFGWVTPLSEGQVVDEVSTRMWAASITADFEFEGQQLDIEKVYEQVQKLFPGRWNGPFTVGSRGIRFWDASASDPTAAVVAPTGMVYFSDGGGFKPWAAILGTDVVSKLSAESLRELTSRWYYDESKKEYIYHDAARDEYGCKNRTQFLDRMSLAGLDDDTEKRRAIVYVEDHKPVAAVVSLANQKKGLVKQGGITYLNATQTVLINPTKGPCDFILGAHKIIFGPEQFDFVVAWLQEGVQCVYALEPSYSQALFMAGDVQCGKSLLQFRVWTPMFGGKSADPMPYLLGETGFNAELADAGHWLVSDAEGARNIAQRSSFTQKIKAIAANPEMSVQAKYKTPVTLLLNSRISFSFNKTDECLSVIPRLGTDIMDKILLFNINEHDFFKGLDRRVIEGTIKEELPHFIYWLLNEYSAPDHVRSNGGRYRTKSYHSPELMQHAKACQDSSELLGWLNVLFTQNETLASDYLAKGVALSCSAARWLQLIIQTTGHHHSMSTLRLSTHFQNLARQFPDAITVVRDTHDKVYHFSVDYKKLTES